MNQAQWHLVGGVQAILGCIVRPNPASKPKTPHSPGSWVMVRWALFMFFFYLGVWGWEGPCCGFHAEIGSRLWSSFPSPLGPERQARVARLVSPTAILLAFISARLYHRVSLLAPDNKGHDEGRSEGGSWSTTREWYQDGEGWAGSALV